MAGSRTKGRCIVNLNNMKNKAPVEMYELKKRKRKKREKKGVHTFSNRGLRCSWRPIIGYIFFANSTTSCSILALADFDELLGLPVAGLDVHAYFENKNIHDADPKACSCT